MYCYDFIFYVAITLYLAETRQWQCQWWVGWQWSWRSNCSRRTFTHRKSTIQMHQVNVSVCSLFEN